MNKIREEIDKIDKEILKLLEKRFDAVLDVSAKKEQQGLLVRDFEREQEVLKKIEKGTKNKYYQEYTKKIYEDIMKHSREMQEQHRKK